MSEIRYCSQCGHANSYGDRFCSACGRAISRDVEQPAADEPTSESEEGSGLDLSDLFWLVVGAALLITFGPSVYRAVTGSGGGSSGLWDNSGVEVEVGDCGAYYRLDDPTPATGTIRNSRSEPVNVFIEIGWYEDGVKVDDSNTNVRVRADGTARFTTNGGSYEPFDECLIDDIKAY